MPVGNGYAALVKQRSSGGTKRRKLDDYETPESVTMRCLEHVEFKGPIMDPASGSGRIVRVLREEGFKAIGFDIKRGTDFLLREKKWHGDIVTNPPYRNGLAEAFARQALKIATGKVAMLFQSGFIWGDKRGTGLFREHVPQKIVIIPERIYFLVNGKPIESQFFSHAWVIWSPRWDANQRWTETIWSPYDEYADVLAERAGPEKA